MTIEFTTTRLTFRLISMDDLDSLNVLHADPDVRKFFPSGTLTKEQTREMINKSISSYREQGLPRFIVHQKEDNAFVGRCGFGLIDTGEIEVGYLVMKEYWGKGYATEMLKAMLLWARDNIESEYIIAFAPENHLASQRVMQKVGMKYYKDDIGHGVKCKFFHFINSCTQQ